MVTNKIILKDIIIKLGIEKIYLYTYSYLVENENLSVGEKISKILNIIIKDNTPLFSSNTNDYSGLDISNPHGDGTAVDTLCSIIESHYNCLSKEQIIYVTKGLVTIILNRKLTNKEVISINDSYTLLLFFNNEYFSCYSEVKEFYNRFKNTYCADSSNKGLELVMLSLYIISGKTILLYSDFKRLINEINDDYHIRNFGKIKLKEIERLIKRNTLA